MPTDYWYPLSTATVSLPGGWDQHNNVGGANKNASTRCGGGRAGPPTHDDGTSYTNGVTNETYAYQCVNIDWPSPMAAYNSYLTAGARHAYGGGAVASTSRFAMFVNSGGTNGGHYVSVTGSSASWTTTGPIDVSNGATYKPGGTAWATTDFLDSVTIFAGLLSYSGVTGWTNSYFTSVFGQITYSPPSGGFGFLLNLVGTAALPFVGQAMDWVQFRKMLDWREKYHMRRTTWKPGEDYEAYLDYKNYRWPTQFDLGRANGYC